MKVLLIKVLCMPYSAKFSLSNICAVGTRTKKDVRALSWEVAYLIHLLAVTETSISVVGSIDSELTCVNH